jgi:hypothetical protein
VKINLTALLERAISNEPPEEKTDAGRLPLSQERTSPYRVYAFKLEETEDRSEK